jgi:DnaJ like chaperone protein
LSWWGKLLGGSFGFLLGGPLGALIGIALGHNFDTGLVRSLRAQLEPGDQERVQTAFFTAVFSVMGHLAKADGRVTESEIELARDIMQRMSLNSDMRQAAIRLFNQGKQPDFSLTDVLRQFRLECHGRRNLMRMFAEILVHAAYADGGLDAAERRVLEQVRSELGFSAREFRHIEAVVYNARYFGGHGAGGQAEPAAGRNALREAYAILGVEETAGDAKIKLAYRRMMNQHHPDKLVAKGLPEEMIRLATEKTQEIKQAYELIRKERGKK